LLNSRLPPVPGIRWLAQYPASAGLLNAQLPPGLLNARLAPDLEVASIAVWETLEL